MAPRKNKSTKRANATHCSAQPSAASPSSAAPSASAPGSQDRDSLLAEFAHGASNIVASSPASVASAGLQDFIKVIFEQLEEEHRLTRRSVASNFEKLVKALGRVGDTVYNTEDPDQNLSPVEAAVKVLEEEIPVEPVSRRGNNSDNDALSRAGIRFPRRSRSVEPTRSQYTTILSHRTRHLSSDRRELKTPHTSSRTFNIATVTPHPQFTQTTHNLSILRKPVPGEVAISMHGSPLMVNSDAGSAPSVTVPLADGRVFNVLGRSSPFKEEMKNGLDEYTKERLKQLKDFIGELV